MPKKEIQLKISGDIREEETHTLTVLICEESPLFQGKLTQIHIKDSVQLRNFCIDKNIPLFSVPPKTPNGKLMIFAKYDRMLLFSYVHEHDSSIHDYI